MTEHERPAPLGLQPEVQEEEGNNNQGNNGRRGGGGRGRAKRGGGANSGGGAARRGQGFTEAELNTMLDLIQEMLPIGNELWDQLTDRFNQAHRYPGRTAVSRKNLEPSIAIELLLVIRTVLHMSEEQSN